MYSFDDFRSKGHTLELRLRNWNVPDELIDLELAAYETITNSRVRKNDDIKDESSKRNRGEHTEFDGLFQKFLKLVKDCEARGIPHSEIASTPEYKSMKGQFASHRERDAFFFANEFPHNPAYFFVLNYSPEEHQPHVESAVFKNGIFHAEGKAINRTCIGRLLMDENIADELYDISYEDKAVLVDSSGKIIATNAQIEPQGITSKSWLDLEERNRELGLLAGGNTRQHKAIAGSKAMRGASVYTLGESGVVRRYFDGNITFSTSDQEDRLVLERLGMPRVRKY